MTEFAEDVVQAPPDFRSNDCQVSSSESPRDKNRAHNQDLVPYTESPKKFPVFMTKLVGEQFDHETKKMKPEHTLILKVNSREEALNAIRDGYSFKSKDRLLPVFLAWFIGLWVTLFLATSGVSLPIGISIFTIQSIDLQLRLQSCALIG